MSDKTRVCASCNRVVTATGLICERCGKPSARIVIPGANDDHGWRRRTLIGFVRGREKALILGFILTALGWWGTPDEFDGVSPVTLPGFFVVWILAPILTPESYRVGGLHPVGDIVLDACFFAIFFFSNAIALAMGIHLVIRAVFRRRPRQRVSLSRDVRERKL